ncbi:DUF5131 family protein [bacterium]|nr:MAG: DUF5131 family protein [bacterium]
MAPLQGWASDGNYDQSHKWNKDRQQTGKPRTGDPLRTNDPCEDGSGLETKGASGVVQFEDTSVGFRCEHYTSQKDRGREFSGAQSGLFNQQGCGISNLHTTKLAAHSIIWPLKNVWLGCSVENQATADERIPLLLRTPAAVRFVSYEPALGPLDLDGDSYSLSGWLRGWHCESEHDNRCDGSCSAGRCPVPTQVQNEKLDWVIVGGESGPGARPMHPGWARSVRDQCQAAGVPFFFKQWGEWAEAMAPTQKIEKDPGSFQIGKNGPWIFDDGSISVRTGKKLAGRLLDGREWNEFPETK